MNVSLRITLIYKGITLDVHSCGFRQHRNYQNKLKSSGSTRERDPAGSGNFFKFPLGLGAGSQREF